MQTEQGSARMIWIDVEGKGRNVFALFRRDFELDSAPPEARLHLFSDSRHRLRVNGEIVAHGPARATRSRPEHDTVDLAPWLRPGANTVTVEVNAFGAPTFEAEPSRGGFVAWGGIGARVDFATPGGWIARRLDSRDEWSPPWSFAQAPVEVLHAARDREEWHRPGAPGDGWISPVVAENDAGRGALTPRSIPPADEAETRFVSVKTLHVLDDGLERIGFRLEISAEEVAASPGARVPYLLPVWSPREQVAVVRAFWGPHFLNGARLETARRFQAGNREDFTARFRAGMNLLYGEPEVLQECWGVLVGLPLGAGLRPYPIGRYEGGWRMRFAEPLAEAALRAALPVAPADEKSAGESGLEWRTVANPWRPPLPARELGWDEPAAGVAAETDARLPLELDLSDGRARSLVFDAGGEFIARWWLEAEAPAGTVFDLATDEVLRADGLPAIYRDQFLNNTADRVVWGGGARRVTGFRPRGGRYLQIVARPPVGGGRAVVRIRGAGLRSALTRLEQTGDFACSDPVLSWAWRAGADTVRASYEDAFVDPWRERGVYVGDTLVEHLATAAMTADDSMTVRCLRMWAAARMPDGLILDNAPSGHDKALADYSLVWILIARDLWARGGDRGLAAEFYEVAKQLLAAPAWREAPGGLWTADHLHVFIDWAAPREAKRGESAALNGYRGLALLAAAELAEALGLAGEARGWRSEHERVKRAFQALWREELGEYACSRRDGAAEKGPALHGNILALRAGLAPEERRDRVLAGVVEKLRENHRLPAERVELFFLHHALALFYAEGLAGEAEGLIRRNHGVMRDRGAWTLWECLAQGLAGRGSFCHGWSASPTHYLSREALGVRWARAGDPGRVVVAPLAEGLIWARGRVPHPAGVIEVSWRIEAGSLCVEISVPPGVGVEFTPRGALARLPRLEAVAVR